MTRRTKIACAGCGLAMDPGDPGETVGDDTYCENCEPVTGHTPHTPGLDLDKLELEWDCLHWQGDPRYFCTEADSCMPADDKGMCVAAPECDSAEVCDLTNVSEAIHELIASNKTLAAERGELLHMLKEVLPYVTYAGRGKGTAYRARALLARLGGGS